MATYLGIKPDQQIYSYCGGGIAATVPFFALKFIADYPQVKLYQESLLGWLQDERGLPLRTYDAPLLMRETNWLKTWSGKMMRTYDVSRVSVIDVRPADAFKQGHVPYALNVPADVFKSHLKSPEKLAEILGQAGVNPSHEAVVISDAGLNANSAIAFFMLEGLGRSACPSSWTRSTNGSSRSRSDQGCNWSRPEERTGRLVDTADDSTLQAHARTR